MKKIMAVGLISFMVLSGCAKAPQEDIYGDAELEKANQQIEALNLQLDEKQSEIEAYESQIQVLEQSLEDEKNISAALATDLEAYRNSSQPTVGDGERLLVLGVNDTRLSYVFAQQDDATQVTTVIGEEIDNIIEPNEFTSMDFGSTEEDGIYAITIVGSIYNVDLVNVSYNETSGEIEPGDVVQHLDEARHVTLKIHTIFPEGMPNQMLRWENQAGEQFINYVSYDGYGFDGNIVWNR